MTFLSKNDTVYMAFGSSQVFLSWLFSKLDYFPGFSTKTFIKLSVRNQIVYSTMGEEHKK
jgi:hypothetical protein